MNTPRLLVSASKFAFCVVASIALTTPSASAADGTWNVAGSGNYSTPGNWLGGNIAGGAGSLMTYSATSGATPTTITLDQAVTLGGINLNITSTSGASRGIILAIGTGGSLVFDTGDATPALVENTSVPPSSGTGQREINLPAFTIASTGGLEIKNSGADTPFVVRFAAGTDMSGSLLTLTNTVATPMQIRGLVNNPFGTSASVVPDLSMSGNVVPTAAGFNLTLGSLSGGGANAALSTNATSSITFGSATNATFTGGNGLQGNGFFIKQGSGLQNITGNSVSSLGDQTVTIKDGGLGVVDGAGLASNAKLVLDGGVLVTSGDFERGLGTASGQVVWASAASGGFAARGGALTVNLGGAASELEWGAAGFAVDRLLFGGVTAGAGFGDNEVEFQNALDLGGSVREIAVIDNLGSQDDFATLSGVISGTGGVLKSGDGILKLTAENLYSGSTTVNAGTLLANNTAGSATGSGNVVVNSGGTFGGIGSIDGGITLNAGGLITPGDGSAAALGAGSLLWNSNNLAAGMAFSLGTTSDLLSLDGALSRGSGSIFLFDFSEGSGFGLGTYTLVTFGSTDFSTGDFGFTSSISGLNGYFDFAGNSLTFTVIPEPSTYVLLLGVGVIAIFVRLRRRRA